MLSYEDIKNICNEELKSYSDILFCSVFGSYAVNKQKETSDIDIAVSGKQKLSAEQKYKITQKLSDKLKKQVDLIDLQAVSGSILHQALTKGMPVFIKSKELYAEIIKRMLYNQADMMPNYNMILKKRRERFLNGK
ncbi:nucleotidyltransferase domain-containing protein [bacterium]|nr:nucleotidyltransferase domain-containing protein [bacterium]